jgi:sugar phosphate isomerase/epimerase
VDEHLAIGEGTIDFRRVLGALRRIRFAGPLIIELFDVPKKLASHRRLLGLLAEDGGRGSRGPRPARRRPAVERRARRAGTRRPGPAPAG